MTSRFYPYATDSSERDVMAYIFAVLAVALAYGLYKLVEVLHFQMPWWLSLPTPMAIYLFVRWLFSNYIWRWGPFRKVGIVKIPYLGGKYHGHLRTSYDEHAESYKCEFTITQTWTKIIIRGAFAKSRSFNGVTGITVEGTDAPRLTYEYWNEPISGAAETMNPHRGTIWFDILLKNDTLHLDGEYYTGRGRATSGRIELVRSNAGV
jgi:SMODS-associating 2TM, beta-strand rich effector domain